MSWVALIAGSNGWHRPSSIHEEPSPERLQAEWRLTRVSLLCHGTPRKMHESSATMEAHVRVARRVLSILLMAAAMFVVAASEPWDAVLAQSAKQAPLFEVDPFWPKPLPNHWVTGSTI